MFYCFLFFLDKGQDSSVSQILRLLAKGEIFVRVEVLWPSKPNGVMSSVVSYLITLLLDRFLPLST